MTDTQVPDNTFAFPMTPEVWATHPDFHGMLLRDWFAGQALAGRNMGLSDNPCTNAMLAKWAFALADAMLAERAKGQPHAR